ncbi:MAG: hypothetical protein RLO81_08425 [Fulvivirga sp.]|uniref:hypothetical protein n=1 Tax=Fulvivirga sp. TaxID=1931237 RepID=UPI0032EF9581
MNTLGQKLKLIGLVLILAVNQSYGQLTIHESEKYDADSRSGKYHSKSVSFSGLKSFELEYRGEIKVNDSDTDVTDISAGGYLEISKTTFGSKRAIVIEKKEGKLVKEYYEGRQKVAFEPDGKKWLAEILPDIVRSSPIAAEDRINRYFNQGGVRAVMNEISRLDGNHVQNVYGKLLLNRKDLSKDQLKNSLVELCKEISSDYYKSSLLKDVADRFIKDKELSMAYFEAASRIDSDYYASTIYTGALKDVEITDELLAKIVEASSNIGSDYYHATVLEEALDMNNLNDYRISLIISSTDDIDSDYYQAQVLSKAMKTRGLSDKSFNSIVNAIGSINSDYYMAEVLEDMLSNNVKGVTSKMVAELLDEHMSSDYYKAAVLSNMLKSQQLPLDAIKEVANTISNMGSSNYACEVIKDGAKNSNYEKAALIELIKACESIDSDYYASEALQSLASQVRNADEEVKSAYRSAAKSISSDTYYGRTVKAIN